MRRDARSSSAPSAGDGDARIAAHTSLTHARRLAMLLDSAVRIPGTRWRVGLDALLGLVPGVGDLAGAALGGWVLWLAARAGATPGTLLRMLVNLAVDALLGSVPLVGDLFDAGYRANLRNVALLERQLQDPAETARAGRGFLVLLGLVLLALAIGGATVAVLLVRWLLTLRA